jgi:hypothetical protein
MRRDENVPWYYEILGRNRITVEQSEPTYRSPWEAEWAGYLRFKEKQAEEGLRSPVLGSIRVKSRITSTGVDVV